MTPFHLRFALLTFLFSSIPAALLSPLYIVLVDPHSKPCPFPSHLHWYSSLLSSSASQDNESPPPPLIHVYETLLHGFSASLTPSQSRRIQQIGGVLVVSPDSVLHPDTTRSPTFLGLDLPRSVLSGVSDLGSDSIIGIVDSGIWPECPSFAEHGDIGPVPDRWRGVCEEGHRFNRSSCNRKLIGARSFSGGYASYFTSSGSSENEFLSARDLDGHGTHVASIAAGSPVVGAGFEGFASGVARGMAPKARIAAYKVCWAAGCLVSDIVAAFDMAVSDGVDVLSVSLGVASPEPFYYLDPLAIASFRTSMRGVFVAGSAGNGGPHPGTVSSAPPWIITVGAGTIDRDFPALIVLGNGESVHGISITVGDQHQHRNHRKRHRLYSAGMITSLFSLNSSLHHQHHPLGGSIVLCMVDRGVSRLDVGLALTAAGAAGMVVSHGDVDPKGILAEAHILPTVAVGVAEAESIDKYIWSCVNPTAVISSSGTDSKPGGWSAPITASFSSRGPNPVIPWILKPDLLAPGVNILGAWTGSIGPSGLGSDIRRTGFNVMSGTSMACPHVAGVAALIRAVHKDWSAAAVKSALMTTAVALPPILDETTGRAAGPFGIGAGHICPERAMDPGLVYDAGYDDYVEFFVRELNYTPEEVRALTGKRPVTFAGSSNWTRGNLNYPAFVVAEEEVGKGVVFSRRLKRVSVGGGAVVYRAEVGAPNGYRVAVEPKTLRFGGESSGGLGFRLLLKRNARTGRRKSKNRMDRCAVGGELRWRDEEGKHMVRSPIVVFSSKLIHG